MTDHNGHRLVTLVAVGDVAPGETDEAAQFDRVRDVLRCGDVTFGQLEEPLSNRGERQRFSGLGGPRWDHAPMDTSRRAEIIADAGFTVMSFASNHTMDRSAESMVDTINAATAAGIALVGAGKDINAARTPAIVTVNATTIGFLAYCSVSPRGYDATANRPGLAPLRARTFYEQVDWQAGTAPRIVTQTYPDDLAAMVADIRRLRERVDVVVVSCHWGIHFEPATVADYQIEAAHAAVDAGADLILGHHPHILKGIEVYRGVPILYAFNNFVLRPRGDDGAWLDEHNRPSDQQKTMLLTVRIEDGRICRAAITPCWLDLDVTPEPLRRDDPRSASVVDYLLWTCREARLDTQFDVDGDELVIRL